MNYGDKIKALRERYGFTLTSVAKYLKIDKSLYFRYENEEQTIPLKHLISLADYFKVSLDYLFNFTDKKIYKKINIGIDKTKAGKRLKEFRKNNKITQLDLAKLLNTNRSLLSNYENGIYLISTSFLYEICKKYNVSADYLLGRIDDPIYF